MFDHDDLRSSILGITWIRRWLTKRCGSFKMGWLFRKLSKKLATNQSGFHGMSWSTLTKVVGRLLSFFRWKFLFYFLGVPLKCICQKAKNKSLWPKENMNKLDFFPKFQGIYHVWNVWIGAFSCLTLEGWPCTSKLPTWMTLLSAGTGTKHRWWMEI